MNIEKAFIIFQIPKGCSITGDYLKKRYRYIAQQIHPDKFFSPSDQINAHYKFIELQEAYEYLQNILLSEKIIVNPNVYTASNADFERPDITNNFYNPDDRPWWKRNFHVFLLPGAFLSFFFGLSVLIISLAFNDIFKGNRVKYGYQIGGAIALSFFNYLILSSAFKYLIEIPNVILIIILTQAIVYLTYFVLGTVFSFRLRNKMKNDIALKE